MGNERTINVPILTRVEGEGGLTARISNGQLHSVELRIYEPPRLFEALLRGRSLEDVADITARICGICPVAYQMSAVHALESALGVRISPEVRGLRRVLYCGEWIESHGLHMHLLQAPDFFGCQSGLELAQRFPDEVKRGLRLKKAGNRLLEVLGGRAIHPVNIAVGGFFRAPRREELAALIPEFEWGVAAALDATRWVAGFDFPEFEMPYDFVSMDHADEYPMNEGDVVCSDGTRIPVAQFETRYEERQVPHSTALHCVKIPEGTPYLVGPLARMYHARDRLSPTAKQLADEVRWPADCRNPFKGIVARGIELVHAFEETLQRLQAYRPPAASRAAYELRAAEGAAATEAPRGLLYHRYQVDDQGRVQFAKIVPPTSQNQAQIEADLYKFVPTVMHQNDQDTALDCEKLIRSYDPCISCSTHFLKFQREEVSG